MTIAEAERFYKQDTKNYEIEKNIDFLIEKYKYFAQNNNGTYNQILPSRQCWLHTD